MPNALGTPGVSAMLLYSCLNNCQLIRNEQRGHASDLRKILPLNFMNEQHEKWRECDQKYLLSKSLCFRVYGLRQEA
jgi:hypothetical protein